MTRPRLVRSLAAITTLATLACTFDQKTVAVPPSQIVVHAVLDPSALVQEVLVERTLSGSVTINDDQRFDPLDPINSGGGVPISGAQVTIFGPDGNLVGRENRYSGKGATYGAGRYEVVAGRTVDATFPKIPIRAGARYTLTVRTPDGAVVTGATLVPNAPAFSDCCRSTLFDRDRDTVKLTWAAAPGARTYGLRIDSPFGPFLLFSDTTHLNLTGSLRNVFANDLQRLFIPGFQQVSTIFAVDTNFFDYYRSRNDPFTGSGIINHLQGGIGLFGASVILDQRTLDVTQQPKDPAFEGVYEIVQAPSPARSFVDVMRLYVETKGTTSSSLSGWYVRDRVNGLHDGVAGARDGARIELKFKLNQSINQTFARFVGTQVADSLIGAYVFPSIPGRVVFRRRP